MILKAVFCVLVTVGFALGQNEQSYKSTGDSLKGGLLDPSRFSINHSMSMGMSSASGSSLQSQGLYSTLLTYKFSQPVTINLNFGFPIFSTFAPGQNLSAQNLRSAEYFNNMPIEASLAWRPTDNMSFQLSFMRAPGNYYSNYYGYSPFYSFPFAREFASPVGNNLVGR
jgi:ABC-type antimicrobial peptide transport system permease subunit